MTTAYRNFTALAVAYSGNQRAYTKEIERAQQR